MKYPRCGYRRVHVMLLRVGYQVNRKRVQRLWRLEGLHVQRPKRRKPKIARQPIVSSMKRLTDDQSKFSM